MTDGFRALALTVPCLCGAVSEVACAAQDTADAQAMKVLRRADATCQALQKQLQAMAGSMNQTKEENDA